MDKSLDSEILSLTTLCSIICLLLYQYGKTKLASDKAALNVHVDFARISDVANWIIQIASN